MAVESSYTTYQYPYSDCVIVRDCESLQSLMFLFEVYYIPGLNQVNILGQLCRRMHARTGACARVICISEHSSLYSSQALVVGCEAVGVMFFALFGCRSVVYTASD